MKEILIVDNVTKTFNLSKKQQSDKKTNLKKLYALKNVSFSAYSGEIFGLLGPNGAGKTTLLRILATLISADSGKCIIDGHDVEKEKTKVRSKVAFLTSELKLEDFFTPNYLFDFFSSLHNIEKETILKRKEMLFKKFSIDSFANVKIANLSTGMKQKVSLVISIAHDPNVIIFDEPTNDLDVLTAKVVTDFLLELKKEGKTIILSTHIFSLVEKLCDRVGIIFDGEMSVCKPLEEILEDGSLENSFFKLYEEKGGKLVWKIFLEY